LKSLPLEERLRRYKLLLSFKLPCVVFSRNLKPDKHFLKEAERMDLPVFQTPLITMKFINHATLALEAMFAPRGTEIGSMVDILGVGVIIKGESGIGKSESVLALIERGYSLVADDATRVTLMDGHEVIGTCSELTRDHMEVRGIGIVNVAAMFGIKSIRKDKKWTWSSPSKYGRKSKTWTGSAWTMNTSRFSASTSPTSSSQSDPAATSPG